MLSTRKGCWPLHDAVSIPVVGEIGVGLMGVSDLKKGDKTEALVVRYECRDGTQRMWISPIVRPKTGGLAFGDALEMGETAEGRFASLF